MTLPVELVALALLAAALALAVAGPRWLDRLGRRMSSWLRRPLPPLAEHGLPAITALACQLLVAFAIGPPVPRIHDEFSLLLQADTFAHGRLANPTPALWRHFETFHVIVQPTYTSKYPPAQGLVLAAGQLLGLPSLGVWLSGAALCAAGSWMFAAWLRPPAARLATWLLLATLVPATYWSQGYRGGFVAATAGALLFGAAARLRWRPVRARDGLILGAALGILAASRPYEGLFAAAGALGPLLLDAWRWPGRRRELLRRAAAPATIAVVVFLTALAGYNWRVTGDPLRFPYQEHDERYTRVPLFLWQELRSPPPANPVIDGFFATFEGDEWEAQHTFAGWTDAIVTKLRMLSNFYLRIVLIPVFAAALLALSRPRPRWLAGALALILTSQLLILPCHPHYVAPGAALVACLLAEGWRGLRRWRPFARPVGARLAALLPWLPFLLVPWRAIDLRPSFDDWSLVRSRLQGRLEALPGDDLVLVRYLPHHSGYSEWVYNGADLDTAPVLWARSLGLEEDCRLLAAEPARQGWVTTVGEALAPSRLDPLPPDFCPSPPAGSPGLSRSAPAAPRSATAR